MKNEILLDAIGKIDEELVFAAEKSKRKKFPFIKWAAVAAIFAVIIFGAEVKPFELDPLVQSNQFIKIEGFENVMYGPILGDERKEFGILGEDEIGLTEENRYEITEKDIGEFMGTVVEGEEDIIGSRVYHFTKYPDSDKICIIETPEGFEFYVGYIPVQLEIGESSDSVFEIFGFPESLEKMEVRYSWGKTVFEINGEERERVFEIFSGKENFGPEEESRRKAELFFETYKNEDYVFDEKEGRCVEKVKGPVSYIDQNGKKVFGGSPSVLARKLFLEKSCSIILVSENGFELYISYYPAVEMFWARGYFSLSEAETETLNKIFKLE